MQLAIFAKVALKPHISNIDVRIENTGILHIFPNKGGLLICLDVYGTTLAFVSCHLAAHEGVSKCEARNESIKEILGGVRVGDVRFDVSNQKHHMFWMGDMNYRLSFDGKVPASSKRELDEQETKKRDADLKKAYDFDENEEGSDITENKTKKEIKLANFKTASKWVEGNEWSVMLAKDELNREIRDNRALNGFTALQPSFPPTFKRIRHIQIPKQGDKWNLTTSNITDYYDEKRWPSFTDRILHKSMPGFAPNLRNISFQSYEEIDSSDHKPVKAVYMLRPSKGAEGIKAFAPHLHNSGSIVGGSIAAVGDRMSEFGNATHLHKSKGFDLIVSNMSGKNLAEMDTVAFGGGSDPYLVFTSDPPQLLAKKVVRSSYVKHSLNPVWPKHEKVHVPIVSTDITGLAQEAHLFISCWDYDLSNEDDLIGLCRIPFSKILNAFESNQPFEFDEELFENGEMLGRIKGTITSSTPMTQMNKENKAKVSDIVTLNEIDMPTATCLEESTACNCCMMM
jgi:hypothetical protein